jgi:hypothetical protein
MAIGLGTISGTIELEDKFSKALEDLTRSTLSSMGSLGSAITGVAASFVLAEKGISFFVNAVSGAVAEVVQLAAKAEQLQNKSLTTGMTTGAIQSLQRLSENAGLSADAVTFSVSRMQRSLAAGGDNFRKAGLDAQALLKLGTSDQLKAVADRIMAIENPAQRTAAAMEIFGRGGQQLLPVLKQLAEGNEALKISLSDAQIEALGNLDDAIDDMTGSWTDMKEQFFAVLGSSPEFVGALKSITAGLQDMMVFTGLVASGIAMISREVDRLLSKPRDVMEVWFGAELDMPDIGKATKKSVGKFGAAGGGPALGLPTAEEALGMMNVADLKKGIGSIEEQAKALDKLIDKQEKAAKAAAAHGKEMRTLTFAIDGQAFSLAQATTSLDKHLATWIDFKPVDLTKDLLDLNKALGQGPEMGADILGGVISRGKRGAEQALDDLQLGSRLTKSLGEGMKDLPNVMLAAIQGGGDVFKAMGASIGGDIGSELGKDLAKSIGGKLGSALGSLAGPLGSLAGSLAGGLIDKLGIGGNKVIMQVNDMRDSFFEARGGFIELQKQLQGLTNQDLVKQIFDAKTVDEFNASIKEVNDLLDAQAQSQQALQAAIEEYGISVEELGPKFAQQQMDERAQKLFQDFQLLMAATDDVNLVISKMGPSLNEFVSSSIAAGTTIPEAMRPIVEELIKSGQLLDENGEAYKSTEEAGITFAQSMSEQFTTLIDKLDTWISMLLGIPKDIQTNVTVNTKRTGDSEELPGPPGDRDNDPVTPFATGGIVTQPTLGLVAEAGAEAIIPLDKASAMLGSGESRINAGDLKMLVKQMTKALRDAMIQAQ